MCIAIVKPKGVSMPKSKLLKKCWNNNPDGAGFMYNNGKEVIIHKGFMTFNGFYKFMQAIDYKENLEDKDVVFHFRIATSGGVSKETTHPFPVTHNYEIMKKLDIACDKAFVHNGIIKGLGSNEYSDTMEYNKNIIYNIQDIERSEPLINALADLENSRFCVMLKDKYLLGGNWIKDKDLLFSNDSYKWDYYDGWMFYNPKDKYSLEQCHFCGEYVDRKQMKNITPYGSLCKGCADYVNELEANYAK